MERTLRAKLVGGVFRNVSATRSRTMSRIRGEHPQSTDRAFRMALVRAGVKGWRMYEEGLPGKPDLYFPNLRVALFVDGCFWHGCPTCGHIPKTNRAFWTAKLLRNHQRDRLVRRRLKQSGIGVIRIWEHSLRTPDGISRTVRMITMLLSRRVPSRHHT
ncbi:MAG: very short patch repair endonuclease [Verrucomicrobia bacterium]|nr:very short patch repair endonuclease [Verrucomicrobiota bacterium]